MLFPSRLHPEPKAFQSRELDTLIGVLRDEGYQVVGPTLQERAIVFDTVTGAGDLPQGWTDRQGKGSYRLERRDDEAYFGYAVGPHSWKKFLFPPARRLWRGTRSETRFELDSELPEPPRFAFLGVRSCDLHAIRIQDRVFRDSRFADPDYAARRGRSFVVALNCAVAGGNCFCVSMGTGPAVDEGFDLALTELVDDDSHSFLVTAGTEAGEAILAKIPTRPATSEESAEGRTVVERTAANMGRHVNARGVKELLYGAYEHPRWDDVANRCLACANCTMVCPTCFCSTVVDTSDLDGAHVERTRQWDSCFTSDFSFAAGSPTRGSTRSRYRQWMTHKLATWFDQFGTSGCVGCGRCIAWCPVGIDITEELAAIQQAPDAQSSTTPGGSS